MSERVADLPGLQVRTLNAIALAIVNGSPPFAAQPVDVAHHRRSRRAPHHRPAGRVPPQAQLRSGGAVDRGAVAGAPRAARARARSRRCTTATSTGSRRCSPRYRDELSRARSLDFDEQIVRRHRAAAHRSGRLAPAPSAPVASCSSTSSRTSRRPTSCSCGCSPAPDGCVFGVGDDDQTIYGFNGADPHWLIDFADYFPAPATIRSRSTTAALPMSSPPRPRCCSHNARRVPKAIRRPRRQTTGLVIDTGDDAVADRLRDSCRGSSTKASCRTRSPC